MKITYQCQQAPLPPPPHIFYFSNAHHAMEIKKESVILWLLPEYPVLTTKTTRQRLPLVSCVERLIFLKIIFIFQRKSLFICLNKWDESHERQEF